MGFLVGDVSRGWVIRIGSFVLDIFIRSCGLWDVEFWGAFV